MAKLPSDAQARMIAGIFGKDEPVNVMTQWRNNESQPWNAPTTLALIKHGWLEPTGVSHSDNGHTYAIYRLSRNACSALGHYLLKRGLK